MNTTKATDTPQQVPAVGAPLDRGVRPHAIRLASQLQSAAYSHGYEDGHPSNATTRQDKYSAASQRLLSELREAIELLIAERDGLMQTLRDEMDENLRLRELGGARPDENITAMTERLIRERDALREVAARMVAGIDHLDKLTREWEPDHSSGPDRRGWLLAKDARDDAARLLGPNAKLSGPNGPQEQ